MGLKIRVTVECFNDIDESKVYSCCSEYSSKGNTLIQSEVDDYTKSMASNALYITHQLLDSQIKSEPSDKEEVVVTKSE